MDTGCNRCPLIMHKIFGGFCSAIIVAKSLPESLWSFDIQFRWKTHPTEASHVVNFSRKCTITFGQQHYLPVRDCDFYSFVPFSVAANSGRFLVLAQLLKGHLLLLL